MLVQAPVMQKPPLVPIINPLTFEQVLPTFLQTIGVAVASKNYVIRQREQYVILFIIKEVPPMRHYDKHSLVTGSIMVEHVEVH